MAANLANQEQRQYMKIEEALEAEITRGNCKTCPKNSDGVCDVTEELIGSGGEYCELTSI